MFPRNVAVLALGLVLPAAAAAQAFPTKPIRLLIPYPAGGTTDIMARTLQEPMQRALGQPIIVENKPGAAGAIAVREVARAAPDGYNLLFVNSGNVAVAPFVQKDIGYDGVKDFAPVALVSTAPMFMVINAQIPATDLRGFIEYARAQTTPIEYASAGIGSFGHLASELFARMAGAKMVHIPYKGQAPTTNAIVAGEVRLLITTSSAAMNNFISAGKLRLLGVTTSEPSSLAPGAPPVRTVLPGYTAEIWFGVLTTARTPPEVVNRLNEAINGTLADPELRKRFVGFGVEARTSTPQRLAEMLAEDVARWSTVVRESNIRAD